MAFDANLNTGRDSKNSMNNNVSCPDFSDWYPNEESFDLTGFVTDSGNLELCSDDLFQNLFPPTSPQRETNPKKENFDYLGDTEVENFFQNHISEPTSACSSLAPSPALVNYYNTPPVTPQSERQRQQSPHHLQFDGLTTAMSSSRFALMRNEDSHVNFMSMQHGSTTNHESTTSQILSIKQEKDADNHMLQSVPISIKSERHDSTHSLLDPQSSNPTTSFQDGMNKSTAGKGKMPVKGTMEYLQKRRRNNDAVRRSRDKAKTKAMETQNKVEELSSENEQLHKRVAELTQELSTLKKLLQALPQMNSS